MEDKTAAEALVPHFRLHRVLNQGLKLSILRPPFENRCLLTSSSDQAGRRVTLLGSINDKPALLTAERAAFPSDAQKLESFQKGIQNVNNLGANDIYRWYLASSTSGEAFPPDLKLNLIYPCTDQHIKKYSPQGVRMVTETPDFYKNHVRPYMQKKRDEGRLNWVFNIIEGRTEQEDVILRDSGEGANPDDGFLMLPDLNWDRKTLSSLHMLGLVERRDIWSLRDLKKSHVGWLKHMREKLLEATVKVYPSVERDQLKLYIHCLNIFVPASRSLLIFNRSANLLSLPHSHCPRAT